MRNLMNTDLVPYLRNAARWVVNKSVSAWQWCAKNDQRLKPSPGDGQRDRLGWLDGIRAIAALGVMGSHVASLVAGVTHMPVWAGYTLFNFPAHAMVGLFIVLSGFSLALPVVRTGELAGGTWGFYKRRYRRILPVYWAALGLSLLMDVALLHWAPKSILPSFALYSDALFYQGGGVMWQPLGNNQIDGPGWSVVVECQIYLWLPLLIMAWKRFGIYRTTAVVFLATQLTQFYAVHHWSDYAVNIVGLNAQYYGFFALGACAAYIAYSDTSKAIRALPWGIVALTLNLLPRNLPIVRLSNEYDWLETLWVPAFLIFLASRKSVAKSLLSWKPVAFLGTFAYSIYLCHYPLLTIVTNLFPSITMAEAVVLASPVVVALSYVFFLIFERPFVKPLKLGRLRV